jgi:hypothetical protein
VRKTDRTKLVERHAASGKQSAREKQHTATARAHTDRSHAPMSACVQAFASVHTKDAAGTHPWTAAALCMAGVRVSTSASVMRRGGAAEHACQHPFARAGRCVQVCSTTDAAVCKPNSMWAAAAWCMAGAREDSRERTKARPPSTRVHAVGYQESVGAQGVQEKCVGTGQTMHNVKRFS